MVGFTIQFDGKTSCDRIRKIRTAKKSTVLCQWECVGGFQSCSVSYIYDLRLFVLKLVGLAWGLCIRHSHIELV